MSDRQLYKFGDFVFNAQEYVLRREDKPVSLTPKMFEVLNVLIERRGMIVSKDDLMQAVWPDSFVEDGNLAVTIRQLRKALDDDAHVPKFIETIARRGYRFIAAVEKDSTFNGFENVAAHTNKNGFPADKSSKSRKFFIPIIALAVLLIGSLAVGSWYGRNKSVEANAPILTAPLGSEKLSTSGEVVHAVISPDGKNVFYTNGINGKQSIWLRQLESGSNVEIIPPSDHVYAGIALSPDSNFLYFVRRPRNAEKDSAVYRVSIFGGVPAKIVSETHGWISVSPDGEKISFVRCYYRQDENCSLWIADALDGKNERKIASRPPPFRIGDNEFAPDGTSIAFAAGQSENAAMEFGLVEVNIANGVERDLTSQKFFNIKNLAWLPDKTGLLVTASRIPNRNYRIWQIPVDTGDASPLTNDSETYSGLNLDRDGRVLVSTQVKEDFRLRLFQMEEPGTNRDLTDARTLAFAPTGRILFSSLMSGNHEIWSVNPDGGGQIQLTNDTADDTGPIASPGNDSIFFASNRTGAVHVWRMNPDGSNQTQITNNEGGFPLFVSPDGEWLYYHHGLHRTLWRVSAKSRGEQPVMNSQKSRFAVSPDGSLVAFSEEDGTGRLITIVAIADGRMITTMRLMDPGANVIGLDWLPDGKSLMYVLADDDLRNNSAWLHTLDEEAPRLIAGLGDEEIAHFAVSPDGKSFAVSQGGWKHDAVLIKGLN